MGDTPWGFKSPLRQRTIMLKENEYLKIVIESFKKYLPRRIVEKILSNPYDVRVDSERRVVTVLFGDISGFTALSERLDPEDVIKVINKYFEKMVRIVDKYGGDVDKFIGDAILVVFGAPIAHPDDPERAVRAALEMQREMGTIEPILAKGEYVKVTMHIGINTGEVVALNMGVDDRMEYTIMGDNVNLTSRLEGVAKSGEIIISENTYKYVKDIFEFEKLEPVKVKGKVDPVQIYRVLSLKEKGFKNEDLIFVGEPDVKSLPERLLKDFIDNQRNFSLFVKGEKGCGKTTYLSILYDRFDRKNVKMIKQSGQSFFKNIPYQKIKDLVGYILKIESFSSKETIKAKVDNFLLPEESDGIYLLYNIQDFDFDKKTFDIKIKDSLMILIQKYILSNKTLFIFDDFDLFDVESKNIFQKIFNQMQDFKNVSIALSSGEDINFDFTDKIVLNNFDFKNFEEFLNLKVQKKLLEEDKGFLYRRTNGNGGTLVELLNFIDERNFFETVDGILHIKDKCKNLIPDSLKSIFISKIDNLSEIEKKILQYSSVLGYEFKKNDIVEFFQFPLLTVEKSLSEYIKKGFINFIDKGRYSFFSEIFYDSVYNSLSLEKRKSLHKKIGDRIEKSKDQNNEDTIRALAKHFYMANDTQKGPLWLEKVGDLNLKYFSYIEAGKDYEYAYDMLSENKAKNLEKLISIVIKLINVYITQGGFNRAQKLLGENKEFFIKNKKISEYYLLEGMINDRKGDYKNAEDFYLKSLQDALNETHSSIVSKIYNSLGILKTFEGKLDESLQYYNLALNDSLKGDDKKDIAAYYLNIGKIYLQQSKMDEAKKHFQKAYDIYESLDYKKGEMLSLINIGIIYDTVGNFSRAEELYNKALELSSMTKDDVERARIYNNLGNIAFLTGKYSIALEHFKKASEIFTKYEEFKGVAETFSNLGEINFLLGNFTESKKYYEETLNICEKISHKHLKTYSSLNYANLLSFLGYLQKGEEMIESCQEYIDKNDLVDFKIISLNFSGKIIGLKSFIEKEKKILYQALDLAKSVKNLELENSVKSTLIKSLIESNEIEAAENMAYDVLSFAEESNNEILVADVYASLADIYVRTQNVEKISTVAEKSFDLLQKTESKLSLLRTYISMARFYLLTEDFTSCENILKECERLSESIGSIEHMIIVKKIQDDLYAKLNDEKSRYYSLLKCVNIVQKYQKIAGEDNRDHLLFKRGFINYYVHLMNLMFKMYDTEFIINVLKDFQKDVVFEALKRINKMETSKNEKLRILFDYYRDEYYEENR